MKKEQLYVFKPLIWVFLLVTTFCIVAKFTSTADEGVDTRVVFLANLLLFFIATVGIVLQLIAMKNKNPYAMIRGVMGSMVMKLFLLGAAAFIYIYFAGERKSTSAIFISMALYLIYTWIEVRIAMKLKPPTNDGGN
jgi:hypothetical protein